MALTREERITKSKIRLQSDKPFFGWLTSKMRCREATEEERKAMIKMVGGPTVGINKQNELIYTEWIDTLNDEQLKTVVTHEVLHCAFLHMKRKANRQPMITNISDDIIVNNILVNDGFQLPKCGIIPHNNSVELGTKTGKVRIDKLDKKSTEDIYDEIYRYFKDDENGKSGGFDYHEPGDGDDDDNDGGGEGEKGEEDWAGHLVDAMTYCFDDKTEILTDSGWKLFKDLISEDKIATMHTATKGMSFQKPTEIIKKDYDGEMLHIKNNVTDVMVTPNHRFFILKRLRHDKLKRVGKEELFRTAENLVDGDAIPRTAMWEEGNENEITIAAYKHEWMGRLKYDKEKRIPADIYAEFLGWFLSEGNVILKTNKKGYKRGGVVTITQTKNKKELEQCLKKFCENSGFRYSIHKQEERSDYIVSSVQLATHLIPLGKSRVKYIPKEIKEKSPKILKILLDSLIMGDGHQHTFDGKKTGTESYYTGSKRLADDVQEIAQKCGYTANIHTRIMNKKSFYRVAIYNNKKVYSVKKDDITRCEYKGIIYCVTVPNEIILVRRNGKTIFTGNSKERGKLPAGMERLVDALLNKKIDWRQKLYKFITNELPSDFTWQRPAKHSFSTGIYMPAVKKEMIDVVVSIDTSGSIGPEELSVFMGQVISIAESFANIRMTIIVCDAAIQGIYEVKNGNKAKIRAIKPKGGGGTSHVQVYKHIKEKMPNAKVLIALTDGFTSFPSKKDIPSNLKTLWVLTKESCEKEAIPFGEVVKLR